MKKFMRIAMVLALAGSALLYSGCTKDYQQSIDDLNSKVNTLNSDVTLLKEYVSKLQDVVNTLTGTEVPAIKERITNCENLIKALQEGSATKAEVAALTEAINADLLALATKVGANQQAIAALSAAFELLNVGKVSSIALVPSNPIAEPMQEFELTIGPGEFPETLIDTKPQLYLQYAVRPYYLAALFTADNSALHVATSAGDAYLPVNVVKADAETGNVYLIADIPAEFNLLDYFPFSYEVADGSNGILNNIKSPFNFAFYSGQTTQLQYVAYEEATGKVAESELPGYEIPWNEFAKSTRTFFEGYKVGFQSPWGEGALTLDEAAECFGVDVATITPEFKSAIDADKTYFTADAEALTVKMAATKAADAVKAVGKVAEATAQAYFTVDYLPFVVLENTQDYTVTAAQGETVVIESYNFPWVGKDRTPYKNFQNATVSGKLPAKYFSLGVEDLEGRIVVKADDKLADVTIPAGMFTFTDKSQTFLATYSVLDETTQLVTNVEMTITLDPKPADKAAHLGDFWTDGSANEIVTVKLPGAVKTFVDGDEAFYENFEESPLYGDIASEFTKNNKITKVVVTYADNSVKKIPYQKFADMFDIIYAYDDKESKDLSEIELTAGVAAYGASYVFWAETEAYGVKYEYTFQINIKPADFALVTTPMVEAGNIINVYAEITNDKYTINDAYFSDYFGIDKVVNDVLKVKFAFDYEADEEGEYICGGQAFWGTEGTAITSEDEFDVNVNVDTKTLERDGKFLNWGTYEGRKIFGQALLGYTYKDEFIPVGKALEFTLVTPDPVKSFSVTAIKDEKNLRVAGKPVTVDLAPSATILSQIHELPIVPDAKYVADKNHKYSWYNLEYGYILKGDVAPIPAKIEGKLNGAAFTFVKDTHYTVDGLKITFLANNAYGDIEFSLPMGIRHDYDYGSAEHTATLDVTILQDKQ